MAPRKRIAWDPGTRTTSGSSSSRIGYTATSVKTVEFWGENELVWTIGGSFVYRLLGEVLFNVTNNTGTRYGTKVKTTTASSAYLDPVEAATSGGQDRVTC